MKILILDDGKVGHIKQSFVVAGLITRKECESSFGKKEIEVKTGDIVRVGKLKIFKIK